MDISTLSAISSYTSSSATSTSAVETVSNDESRTLLETDSGKYVEGSPSAVYEQSDLITMLQNDAQARADSLKSMVADALQTQAGLSVGGDDVWKFLASGNYTVTEAAKEQAQELVSEDGYYGVEQTSDRILSFAKALSGGDTSKAQSLLEAFEEGFEEATKSWGQDLPEISQKTYEAVEKKFNDWMNGTETSSTTEE